VEDPPISHLQNVPCLRFRVPIPYCSLANSLLTACKRGRSESASFQAAKNFSYSPRLPALSFLSASTRARPRWESV